VIPTEETSSIKCNKQKGGIKKMENNKIFHNTKMNNITKYYHHDGCTY
jgi:hypothetical protein